jgi:hypothetical protein
MPNWRTQLRNFFRDLPSRASPRWPWPLRKVRQANIPDTDRDIFERYGETVISMQVSGSFTANPVHARAWLTERADYHERRERWISGRDLFLDIVIIALIGWEIYEGRQQAKVLQHMDNSTAATATAMQTARDSLKSLADAQNEALKILKAEEADRLAQLAKRPALVLYVGHVPLAKARGPLKPSQETDTSATFDIVLKNVARQQLTRSYGESWYP